MQLEIIKQWNKENKKQIVNPLHIPHLIIGNGSLARSGDLTSLLVLHELENQYPGKNLLLAQETFESETFAGPSLWRGVENFALLKNFFPQLEENFHASLFYKDHRWHSFEGRTKPQELASGEEFFKSPSFTFSPSLWMEDDEIKTLREKITLQERHIALQSIDWKKSENQWVLHFSNGVTYSCEKLFFNPSPTEFLKLFSGKDELSDQFHQFCYKKVWPSALTLRFYLDEKIKNEHERKTLFLPQSITHQFGHFLAEFSPGELKVLLFISEEMESPRDEMAKKIKSCKKILFKTYPEIEKMITSEEVVFYPYFPQGHFNKNFDLEFYSIQKRELPQLFFMGMEAPLDASSQLLQSVHLEKITHLTRAYISCLQTFGEKVLSGQKLQH